jgi:hypothetical protein
MPPDNSNIKVFLSHRMDDGPIAMVIHKFLQNLGVKASNIFFTSATDDGKRPTAGDSLSKSIATHLRDCNLFILVFTRSDEDWQWCMWELGLALDADYLATKNLFDTKVVVFQCTDDVPKVLQGMLRVMVEKRSIENFVMDLCTNDGFIPGKSPTLLDAGKPLLKREARAFFEELKNVVPARPGRPIWRWDWLNLKLTAEDIATYETAEHTQREAIILEKATVVQGHGSSMEHFNFSPDKSYDSSGRFSIDPPISLRILIDRWKRARGYDDTKLPPWGAEIVLEIMKSIEQKPASPQRELMKSASEHPDDWYYPILNHVDRKGDGNMEFSIYMYRLPKEFPWLRVDNIDLR